VIPELEIQTHRRRVAVNMSQTNRAASAAHRLVSSFLRPSVGTAPPATLALRAAVGGVFLVSGLLKFLYANQGPLRFAKIGLPVPELTAGVVGVVEIVGGTLLILGLFTRLAALPLVVDMAVALATTKVPLLFGAGPEPVSAPPTIGFWAFAYQARLDVTMLIAAGYLLAVGAGLWSIDAVLSRRRWADALFGKLRSDSQEPAPPAARAA
jgi:uncharacterized membrane protein YphA (DoxX/SURF4 family)